MTNLEAFLKAMGYQGGTIHQIDNHFRCVLELKRLKSVTELESLSDWLDFLIVSVIMADNSPLPFHSTQVQTIKQALINKFG